MGELTLVIHGSVEGFDSVRMLTTIAFCVAAVRRNVPASIGPLSEALFIGGVATGCVWSDEAGDMSKRDAITMSIAIEVTAIKATDNSVVLRFDIMSSAGQGGAAEIFVKLQRHSPAVSSIGVSPGMVTLTISIGYFDSCSSKTSQSVVWYSTLLSTLTWVISMIPTGLTGNTWIVSTGYQTFICVSDDVLQAIERNGNRKASGGKMSLAADVVFDMETGTVALDNYETTPVLLKTVTREPSPY